MRLWIVWRLRPGWWRWWLFLLGVCALGGAIMAGDLPVSAAGLALIVGAFCRRRDRGE